MSDQMTDLTQAINALEDIADLPRDEWFEMIEDLSEEFGYFNDLGRDHAVAFLDEGPRLLVSFDSFERATERTPKGYPNGMSFAGQNGWSSLTLLSKSDDGGAPWFRSKEVIGYFDRLVDEGFFEDFDQVVFYGAGAAGYAASAFSVAAPGATVVVISPQATLDSRLSSWDKRFGHTRRVDFSSRFGFAPDMVDAAERAFVFYDPRIAEDAMHAAMFNAPHMNRIPLRLFGADPEFELMEMGVLDPILHAAMSGTLDGAVVRRALRKRRDHMGYMRRLLNENAVENRPFITACLCRHVLRGRKNAPRFRRAYKKALDLYEQSGKKLPFETLEVEAEA